MSIFYNLIIIVYILCYLTALLIRSEFCL